MMPDEDTKAMRGEELEQVRQAVRKTYGTEGPVAPQDAALDEALGRARGLADGAPAGADAGVSLWRRQLRRFLRRLLRFETYWQREQNRAQLQATEGVAHRLQDVAAALGDLSARVAAVQRFADGLETRLFEESVSRSRLGETMEARARRMDAGQAALGRKLDDQVRTAEETVRQAERGAQAARDAMEKSERRVGKDLDGFRQEVGRFLQGGESFRRGLLHASTRLTILEKEVLSATQLAEGLRQLGVDLAAVRVDLDRQRQESDRHAADGMKRHDQTAGRLEGVQDRLARADKRLVETDKHLARTDERLGEADEHLARADRRLDETGEHLTRAGKQIESAEARLLQLTGLAESSGQRLDELARSVKAGEAGVDQARAGIKELQAGIQELQKEVSTGAERIDSFVTQEEIDLDPLAFAERFRGSEKEIEARLKPYVDLLGREAVAKVGPVLDIGCGRGEFLHLCRKARIRARGVERDRRLVAHVSGRGLDVDEADALEHLRSLDEGSLGGVFSSQLIEHLPAGRLQAVVVETYRRLAAGGIVILETLNPECLSMLSTTFFRDPTHRRPVHPETAAFILEAAGFEQVQVVTHTPVPEEHRLQRLAEPGGGEELKQMSRGLNEQIDRLNHLLFLDQEYHVIGKKP